MEKQKRQTQTLSSQNIVILWAVIQSFGWAMLYLLLTNIDMGYKLDPVILGFIGLFSGGVTGALQHTLIERGAGINLRYWMRLTAIGLAIGLASIAFMDSPLFYEINSPYLWFLPIFLVPSMLQWISIRQHTQSGWLWMVVNSIASMIFVMFMLILSDLRQDFLSAVVPALLQGVASGFVIIWLLRKLPKQADTRKQHLAEA